MRVSAVRCLRAALALWSMWQAVFPIIPANGVGGSRARMARASQRNPVYGSCVLRIFQILCQRRTVMLLIHRS